MNKLLSICIPTYNRNKELKHLCNTFLGTLPDRFQEIEILVCDNSDEDKGKFNKETLSAYPISYFKNEKNLGFGGNVLECFKRASGEFVWIISDDDDISLDGFVEFFKWFRKHSNNFDCVLMKYKGKNILYDDYVSEYQQKNSLKEFIDNGNFPFTFLAAGIVRKNMSCFDEVSGNLKGNLYIHVGLYAATLSISDRIKIYDDPIITYNIADNTTVTILGMMEDYEKLLYFLSKYYPLDSKRIKEIMSSFYVEMLKLVFMTDLGIYNIPRNQGEKEKLLMKRNDYTLSPKRKIVLLINVLPAFLRNTAVWIYLLFIGNYGDASLLHKCKMIRKRIKANKEARTKKG